MAAAMQSWQWGVGKICGKAFAAIGPASVGVGRGEGLFDFLSFITKLRYLAWALF